MIQEITEEGARGLSKEIFLQEHQGEKPDIWVCGKIPVSTSEEARCECGELIYYDRECLSLFDKKVKKICVKCALKLDISKTEREILENV